MKDSVFVRRRISRPVRARGVSAVWISNQEQPSGYCLHAVSTTSSEASGHRMNKTSGSYKNALGHFDDSVQLCRYAMAFSGESACVLYVEIFELTAVVSLNCTWRISKKDNRSLDEINCGVAALLFIWVNKPLP